MALPKYYNTGTVSVANGATAVTGTGTAWNNIVKADDVLRVGGYSVRIASVADNTHLTLAEPWPGTSLTDDPYEIAITYDGPEFQLRTRELLEGLAGAVQTVAEGDGVSVDASDPNNIIVGLDDAATVRDYLNTAAYVATRASLKALDTTKETVAFLTENRREGLFVWRSGDYSFLVATDTVEGVYLKADAIASSSGAWVRAGVRETFNVQWFGADPTGSVDSAPAIQAAIDLISYSSATRGGVILIPKGQYKCSSTITVSAYAASTLYGIRIKGEGKLTTALNFTTAAGGSNGVVLSGIGVDAEISDLSIIDAPAIGLKIIGGAMSSSDFAAKVLVREVYVALCGGVGFHFENVWNLTVDSCWANSNASGFNFQGHHTTLDVRKCYAQNSTGSYGFSINAVTEGTFTACASDDNLWGFLIYNIRATTLLNCGGERNLRETFCLLASDAVSANVLTTNQNIKGLSLKGCFSYHASSVGAGSYGAISATTANSRPIEFSIEDCVVISNNTGSDYSLKIDGASGKVKTIERGSNTFDSLVSFSNTYEAEGRTFDFTPTLRGTSTVGVATPTGAGMVGRWILQDGWLEVEGELHWSAHTGTGNMAIGNLPYLHKSGVIVPVEIMAENITYTGALVAYIVGGAGVISLAVQASASNVAALAMDTAGALYFRARYKIA